VALIHQYFQGRHQSKGQALFGSLTYGAGGMLGGLAAARSGNTMGQACCIHAAQAWRCWLVAYGVEAGMARKQQVT